MPTIQSVGEDVEQMENAYTVGENAKWHCNTEEWLGIFL